MHNVKVNQVYIAPAMAGRIVRRIRILAPNPDGGYIIKSLYNASMPLANSDNNLGIVSDLALEKAYKLETDVCEHRAIDDAYIDSGGFSPPVPNYYKCLDCGDLFPNTGDTALWFPKPLESSKVD